VSSRIGGMRNRMVNAMLGVELREMLVGFQQSLHRNERKQEERDEEIAFIFRRLSAHREALRIERDGVDGLKRQLDEIRGSSGYAAAFDIEEPLVSVRIASYARTDELLDIAIASVLAQSYQNFELIVVNDGPNDATRAAIAGLHDQRIRYEEFPERREYPEDRHFRWMVAGSPGMNRGADLAAGTWIAPLDEDDSFAPDHIEKLLNLAREQRAELSYGALTQRNLINGAENRIWSYPPKISQFSFQGALYLRSLHPAFRYDESSWIIDEPGDWNLIRRMVAAGVTMAATQDVVARMNQTPYTHKESD
jgi:hypothetical protein